VSKDTFRADFKRSLITGFVALFPAILTILIIVQLCQFVDVNIGKPVNAAIKSQLQTKIGRHFLREVLQWPGADLRDPERLRRRLDKEFPTLIGLSVGFLVAVFAIYVVGRLLTFFFGRKLFGLAEHTLARFPIVKVIYPYARQVTDFLFADRKVKFNSVVAIEYPRKGIFVLGFLTNEGVGEVSDVSGQRLMSIFIPSSPTPVTGYVVMVPERDVMPLAMTVDEAIRYTISGGVLVPSIQGTEQAGRLKARPSASAQVRVVTPNPAVDVEREERSSVMNDGEERSK